MSHITPQILWLPSESYAPCTLLNDICESHGVLNISNDSVKSVSVHAKKAYMENQVQLHSFLISTLGGV